MSGPDRVIVLGGGIGGLVAASELRKRLPEQHEVVIVDREPDHLFSPSLLWLMTGQRRPKQIVRPLRRLERKGIRVVCGDITDIDPGNKSVDVAGDTIEADHIVVSLGAELAPERIPGLEAAGHNLYSLAGVEGLRRALGEFDGGRIVVLTAAPAYKCPAAPYEAAMLLEHHLRKAGDHIEMAMYAAEPGPLGVAGPEVSAGVRQMVEEKGIAYHPEHQVAEVDAATRRIAFTNSTHADFDLLVYVPPHTAPGVVRAAGMTDESGWIPVDRNTMETRFDGIYAIGDVTNIPLAMGKPLPMAGVFAHLQAEVVARNLVNTMTGQGTTTEYDGFGECFVETGSGKAGFGKGNFYAEPFPAVRLRNEARRWHAAKVLFEKRWLTKWF